MASAELRVLVRQSVGYGIVGLLALAVDWSCFVALTWCGMAVVPANLLARISGAGISYGLNGKYTFRGPQGSRLGWRRFMRFASAWVVVTIIGTIAMQMIHTQVGMHWAWLAKPVVEVALAGISFLTYRLWIYR